MSLLHIGGSSGTSVVPAEGIDLDGTYDYLSKSTDLVDNIDSKTFTFSCWVYLSATGTYDGMYVYSTKTTTNGFFLILNTVTATYNFAAYNSAGTEILRGTIGDGVFIKNTWLHVLISVDLANPANRSVYVNDIAKTVTWGTYTNELIDFTQNNHQVNSISGADRKYKGRLSNIFLDYVYRDLSIEANRRLFITADGKPADGWKSLNPIIGMSMKDASTAHINDYGYGGNFTANGTFATSNRGANQDNCVASYFDGTSDYLSRTSLTGANNSKVITFSCIGKTDGTTTVTLLELSESTSLRFYALLDIASGGLVRFRFAGYNNSGVVILRGQTDYSLGLNSIHSFSCSVDLSDTNKRHLLVDGKTVNVTWVTYTNDTINLLEVNEARIARDNATTYGKADIGELYFETAYYDLSVYNPFWIED